MEFMINRASPGYITFAFTIGKNVLGCVYMGWWIDSHQSVALQSNVSHDTSVANESTSLLIPRGYIFGWSKQVCCFCFDAGHSLMCCTLSSPIIVSCDFSIPQRYKFSCSCRCLNPQCPALLRSLFHMKPFLPIYIHKSIYTPVVVSYD